MKLSNSTEHLRPYFEAHCKSFILGDTAALKLDQETFSAEECTQISHIPHRYRFTIVDLEGENNGLAAHCGCRFEIMPYPNCCGLFVLLNFKLQNVKLEKVRAALDATLKVVAFRYGFSNREVQMVMAKFTENQPYQQPELCQYFKEKGMVKIHSFVNRMYHDHICDVYQASGKIFT